MVIIVDPGATLVGTGCSRFDANDEVVKGSLVPGPLVLQSTEQ
jgi:hypothetical protein